ncbi:uncharacterized protein LAJ45_06831 [Morchella importuna]|uniref:uncharacterized protein n=1 Tax=Morchella importuna TaxID=1174673 RepID=UPI001E8EE52D|nr:uncharacterized protein LAJ45_06831 [Morchella importuna]KAH8149291.1 hypothetical protein LAJ45_06831 [Morchella importuna]
MDGPLVLWNEAEVEKRKYPELMGYEHELPPSISHIYDQESWNVAVVHATTISKGSRYLCLFVQRPVSTEDGKHVITETGTKVGPTSKHRDVEEEKSDEEDQERGDEERLKRNIRDLNAIITRINQLIAEKDLSKANQRSIPPLKIQI